MAVSRQRRWQLKMLEQGRCVICGSDKLETKYYCKKCNDKSKERSRKYNSKNSSVKRRERRRHHMKKFHSIFFGHLSKEEKDYIFDKLSLAEKDYINGKKS